MMENKRLIIIGAGSVGGYLAYNLQQLGDYTLLGFLDDDPQKIHAQAFGLPVLGPVADLDTFLSPEPVSVVIGIADPGIRKQIAENLNNRGIDMPNFISPNSWISRQVRLGKGVIVYPGVCINYGCQVGDFSLLNMNCTLGHNCQLSAYTTLAPGVNLAGFTQVETGAELGIGACTRQNIIIGSGAHVGGQAMVTRHIPPAVKVKGVPARIYESALPILRTRPIPHIYIDNLR